MWSDITLWFRFAFPRFIDSLMLSIFSQINLSLEKCLFKFFLFSNFFLQCCVGFCHTTTQSIHMYTSIYTISIHTFLLPKPPSPPCISLLQVITECQIGLPALHRNFSTAIHLIRDSVYMLMFLSLSLSLSFFPHTPQLEGSPFTVQKSCLSPWGGSTESKLLDWQSM